MDATGDALISRRRFVAGGAGALLAALTFASASSASASIAPLADQLILDRCAAAFSLTALTFVPDLLIREGALTVSSLQANGGGVDLSSLAMTAADQKLFASQGDAEVLDHLRGLVLNSSGDISSTRQLASAEAIEHLIQGLPGYDVASKLTASAIL